MFDIEEITKFYKDRCFLIDGDVVVEAECIDVDGQKAYEAEAINTDDIFVDIEVEDIADCFHQIKEQYGEEYSDEELSAYIYDVLYDALYEAIKLYLKERTFTDSYGREMAYTNEWWFVSNRDAILKGTAEKMVKDYYRYFK